MRNRIHSFSIFLFILISASCNNGCQTVPENNKTNSKIVEAPAPTPKRIFIRSLGIRADVMSDHVKHSSKNLFRLFSPDNSFEYYIKWETGQTPAIMKGAITAGVVVSEDLLSRAIGKPIVVNEKAEAFEYGIYEFKGDKQLFRGYEIHDWTDPKRVLVVSVMSKVENAIGAKSRCEAIYNSIEVLKAEELKATLTKIENDRLTIGRGENEEEIYRKVVDKSLIRTLVDDQNPSVNIIQRFDLCSSGQGLYHLKTSAMEDKVQGFWDIYETEDGELILIISQKDGPEGKWAINHYLGGNISIGGTEFKLEPLGSKGGSASCGEEFVQ